MSTTHLHTIDDLMAMSSSERYELIEGELVEVPPSSSWSSVIAVRILNALTNFVNERALGYVTGADGGYTLPITPDTVVAPDFGFLRKEHFPGGYPRRGYVQMRPDFAVEVLSPADEPRNVRRKQELYERAGIPIVWWVDPVREVVTVYQPGQEPYHLKAGDELDGGQILPGFRLKVADIFKD